MYRARILGLGYYIPEKVVTNKDLEAYLNYIKNYRFE